MRRLPPARAVALAWATRPSLVRLCGASRALSTSPPAQGGDFARFVSELAPGRIRNFVIIAHIDAGKSTLSDALLVATGNLTAEDTRQGQVLDKLKVERERGITVKAQMASMRWKDHLLNLVDTPGHVDFSWEVRRSLAAVQGAVLLVDSTQGVQAQTVANFRLAKERGLRIVPCLTKLDLKTSDPAASLAQMQSMLGIEENEVIWTSARTGEGIDAVLDAIVERVPPPPESKESATQCEVVDLWHDQFRGVVVLACVRSGIVQEGDKLVVLGVPDSGFEIKEVGVFLPAWCAVPQGLAQGRVGYLLALNSKGAKGAYVGAVLAPQGGSGAVLGMGTVAAEKPKPTVFASLYPSDSDSFDDLKKAITRLALNDSSVHLAIEASSALGQGFRVGFLGLLHMDVFIQRLEDEFGASLISTAPSVGYRVQRKDGSWIDAQLPSQLPERVDIACIYEPMVTCTIVCPIEYVGSLIDVLLSRRGRQVSIEAVEDRQVMVFAVPWAEAVTDLHDKVKSVSSGFASFDLREAPMEEANVVRVDLLLNGIKADPLSFVCHRDVAERRGREVAQRLAKVVPAQQFDVSIQAAIGTKVVAKEGIKGMKKDVLVKSGKTVGGGDVTRKMKLLEKQKRGKAKLKSVGQVVLNEEAFKAVIDKKRDLN